MRQRNMKLPTLERRYINTLHNFKGMGFFQSCLIPKVELPNAFIFGGPFKFGFQNVWKCSFVNVCVLI